MRKELEFPNVDQPDRHSCGKEITWAILEYYGKEVFKPELYDKVGDTSSKGTSVDTIAKILDENRLKYKRGTMTIDQVIKYIDKDAPVIMVLQAWGDEESAKKDYENVWDFGHYVAAKGYDIKYKTVEGEKVIDYDTSTMLFEDPMSPNTVNITFNQLNKRWHDRVKKTFFSQYTNYLNYGIAVYGKKRKYDRKKIVPMG